MSANKYIQRQEAVNYPGKKLPVVFCIDVSDSMNECKGGIPTGEKKYSDGVEWTLVTDGGSTTLDSLKDMLRKFHCAMQEDKKASVTCQTAYVTFGDCATKIEDFGIVKNKKDPCDKLVAKDNHTFIVDGIKLSLKMLDEQKQMLKDLGNNYYQPWLIILTDGASQDDEEEKKEIISELRQRQKDNKLTVYTLALSDEPDLLKNIKGYSIYKAIPYDTDKEELKEFFRYLSNTVSSISSSKITSRIVSYTAPDNDDALQ